MKNKIVYSTVIIATIIAVAMSGAYFQLSSSHSKTKADLTQLNTAYADLSNQYNVTQKRNSQYMNQITTLQQTIEENNSTIAYLNSALQQNQKDITRTLAALHSDIYHAQHDLEEAEAQIIQLEKENNIIKQQLEEAQELISQLQNPN